MHSYLRAIGFSNIKKTKDMEEIIKLVLSDSTQKKMVEISDEHTFFEVSKEFSELMGVAIRGEFNENNEFMTEYYFPYFEGTGITTYEDVDIEKHAEKESYAGICDDVKVGVSLIFYLQNVADYLKELRLSSVQNKRLSVTLSGLSLSGKIILPVNKNEKQIKDKKKITTYRNKLIAAARDGDEEAIENLTLEDIDTYTMISKRIMNEDILTLVDTYFMPYGVESDQYSVLGEIMDFSFVINHFTKEEVCLMTIECNELVFDVCINKKDLLGEPSIGRRFKGNIWLQGKINFNNL
ncbi:DUF3881 family protein [Anaerosacchariphilus polymeriproducens]|uniref:DUF3881 family protein n=1 Tax=Anaerosacchariphilus polymeriproducens TaxID=1812858 RepID=A0A371AVJ8_9FIRM|nr:DUF3881 family protein [Anaerosacchariphilus polymeriproducens]RDU23561.1 DUF3881 family protein [Anaerosacchariphilus polymeriproducens]